MNIFKDSLFSSSSSSRRKSNRSNFESYEFRQFNSSTADPLLYTFDNNDIELGLLESEEETNGNSTERPARTRQARSEVPSAVHNGGSVVIVEKPILPNETIQAFAIRYRVPVSQLKRLNNLQNEQEFHALSQCRVPVQRFGVHHDTTPTTSTLVDLSDRSTPLSLPVTHLSQQNHRAFLEAMDQDLAVMRTKVGHLMETPSPMLLSTSLTTERLKPVVKANTDLKCDGADCGFRVWHIILILILIVLIPLICVYVYIKSQRK